MKTKKQKPFHIKNIIALFLVYLVLFGVLFAMIDYYAYDIINPLLFVIISVISAIIATFIHSKSRKKTKADELASDIKEIL